MPRGLISDEKGIGKIGEEGGSIGPRTPILEQNIRNFLHFFFSPLFYYACSPYHGDGATENYPLLDPGNEAPWK
jgi:hypothetical protein